MKNNSYQVHIEAVLEYIEQHIDSDLSLQTLSHVAGFSPYHFHRIFHAVTGNNLHQYILHKRLLSCAKQLLYEDCAITKIALEHGFATPSAFAKNFKEQFGCTPTQFKVGKERKYPISFAKLEFQEFSYDDKMEEHFKRVNLTDLQTVCIGVTGLSELWENPEIDRAYRQIFNWLHANNKFTPTTKICGITLDSPEVQALSTCRYYACATVDTNPHDQHVSYRNFQVSGSYISCRINRNIENFPAHFFSCMDYLYGFYMVNHNLLPDNRPFVEFYEIGADQAIYIDFCVPVKYSKK